MANTCQNGFNSCSHLSSCGLYMNNFHLFEEHLIYLVSVYQLTDVNTLLTERFYFAE